MTATLSTVTFDCADAAGLARFWAAALEWDVAPDPSADFAAVGGPRRPRDAPSLMFVRVPEGRTAKNRVHLDLAAADLDAEEARLVSHGAEVVHRRSEDGDSWVTFRDPEGNEFCVARPYEIAG
jgi:predicted enzyme related to lactoylglutathione lyase